MNYKIQRIDAGLRKALVTAEDSGLPPLIEPLLRELMASCLRLWVRLAGFAGWKSFAQHAGPLLLMFLSVPQIFRPGGPSLGERNMLQNCYNKVYQAVSFGLKHMDAMCFYSSVLRRLAEFEAAAGLGSPSDLV
mmetsp:Transcript_9520/g.31555  ORF Transcript_9520/g.31555 Transcript_9520/m.31555 type:complete len:134 (+) Transcript_9520:257-658(+)